MTAALALGDAPAFALEDVTVRYPGAAAPSLERAHLLAGAGQLVAIVGPNGAGKTTVLRALLGTATPSAGRALVFGRAAGDWAPDELARAVGVVGQREEPAFPMLVREVVAMGRYAHLGPWRGFGAEDHAAIDRAMRRADVVHLAERWVATLSGGEWQRVRVARALAQDPRALALDEPTASLDLKHEMELFELVLDLVRRDALAALVVSHHINVAARFADRLVLIAAGRVVADGPPADVLLPERLTEVFDWPVAVHRLPDDTLQITPQRRPPGRGER